MKTLIIAPSKSDIIDSIKKDVSSFHKPTEVDWFFYDLSENDVDVLDMIHQCISISMFDMPRVITLMFSASHKSAQDIAQAIQYMDESILCYVGVEGKKFSSTDPIIMAIKKENRTIEVQALTLKSKQEYIQLLANKYKVKLSPKHLEYLTQVLSFDRHQIESEIIKCATYPQDLSLEVLKALVRPQMSDSVFELSKAIMRKDLNQSFSLYYDLMLLKVDPLAIIPILGWQLRLMLQIFELKERGVAISTMNQLLNENPYAFDKAVEYTRFSSHQSVKQLLMMLSSLDTSIKQGKQDKKIGFERFLLESVR
jgi:DNA polymerase III subunit delta